MKTAIQIRLDYDLAEMVKRRAEAAGLTVTEWVRRAVIDNVTKKDRARLGTAGTKKRAAQ
jgi:predicted DNA binding CopG/RHH family protein